MKTDPEVLEILEDARARITDFDNWGIRQYSQEIPVPDGDVPRCRYCALGAVFGGSPTGYKWGPWHDQAIAELNRASVAKYGVPLVWLNDIYQDRTPEVHQKVLGIFDSVIEELEADHA